MKIEKAAPQVNREVDILADLILPDNEVHVWRAGLDLPPPRLKQFHEVLSKDEREKAACFQLESDQNHCIAARGFLRSILAKYLGIEAATIRFSYNKFGKPELAVQVKNVPLQFNLAHSQGLALFAFSRGRKLGVDLEWIHPDFATDEIAARFFASTEAAVLRSLSKEEQPRAFFNCWTRKEAFIKARGQGLSLPLDQFAVTVASGEKPALLSAQDDPQAASRWTLRDLEVEGYAAALVVEGRGWELKCFECVALGERVSRPVKT